MPVIKKTNPVGIDIYVERLQEFLHKHMTEKVWPEGIVWNSYGRCDRNRKGAGYVAEVYTANGEYTDVLWNDKVDVVSFFGVTGSRVVDRIREFAEIHLVVFCNLKQLYPDITHRADEEVRVDFMKAIGKVMYGFHYEGFDLGIERVLREYSQSQRIPSVQSVDIGSIHCFRLNFSLHYNPNEKNSLTL